MLDELEATGYTGSELGDWGFMPTAPDALAVEFQERKLVLTGAFVAVNLSNVDAHAEGEERAVRTAQLLADTTEKLGSATSPFLVLADDSGTNPTRVLNAGRITPAMGLRD